MNRTTTDITVYYRQERRENRECLLNQRLLVTVKSLRQRLIGTCIYMSSPTPRHWHIYLHMFTHSMSVTHLHILTPHNWHRYLHVLFTPCQSQMYISSLTLYDICIYMSSLPVIEKSICIYSLPVIDICFYMSSLIPSLTHYMPSLTPCHWYVSICPRSLSLRRVAIYPHSVIDMCIYMSSHHVIDTYTSMSVM